MSPDQSSCLFSSSPSRVHSRPFVVGATGAGTPLSSLLFSRRRCKTHKSLHISCVFFKPSTHAFPAALPSITVPHQDVLELVFFFCTHLHVPLSPLPFCGSTEQQIGQIPHTVTTRRIHIQHTVQWHSNQKGWRHTRCFTQRQTSGVENYRFYPVQGPP